MKKFFLIFFFVYAFQLNAQTDKWGNPLKKLYYYRTYEDFFSGKKISLGKIVEEWGVEKYILLDTITGKKFKVKPYDSSFAGMTIGDNNKKIIYDPVDKTYCVFLGGNSNISCILYGLDSKCFRHI